LPATRAGSHGRYRGHRTHRRRLGRCRRSQARRRRGRILKDQAARFTVSGLLSLSVIAAPLGSTTSMSRDARAAAAPAAAPTAPFTAWGTVAVKASPALACRVLIDSLAASGTRVPAAAVSVVGAAGLGAGGLGAGVFFSGATLAGWVAGAGTSFIAAVDSVGASVRLRAVESAVWFA